MISITKQIYKLYCVEDITLKIAKREFETKNDSVRNTGKN